MTDRKDLTRTVKQEAQNLGFSLVGVTSPDPPRHLDFYRDWLEQGHHADMGWMATERAIERRSDPLQILPECQSILVLGMPYAFPEGRQGEGKIASYAWHENYHDVLIQKMKKLVHVLEQETGQDIPNRWYTDTGPILEREFAQRAGLGWFGKNTTLIHPEQGSYFFLAELLLGIKLEPDPPFNTTHCGSCTRCLKACPTGSLKEPYTLDANLCISYLTIELDDFVPEDLRPKMGDWIFGCDICQEVCPWNEKFASQNWILKAFRSRPETSDINLTQELSLSEADFREKFKGSPVKRTKRRGYLRNVAIALGNTGGKEAVPALVDALHDAEPVVRGHAAWALGQIGGNDALNALQEALPGETHQQARHEIQSALHTLQQDDPKLDK